MYTNAEFIQAVSDMAVDDRDYLEGFITALSMVRNSITEWVAEHGEVSSAEIVEALEEKLSICKEHCV